MKKRHNGTNHRKWRITWTILILLFSFISVSVAGSEDITDSQKSIVESPEQKSGDFSTKDNSGSTGDYLGQNTAEIYSADEQEGTEENLGKYMEETKIKDGQDTIEDKLEDQQKINNHVNEQKNVEGNPEQKTEDNSDPDNQKKTGNNPKQNSEVRSDIDSHEEVSEGSEQRIKDNSVIFYRESISDQESVSNQKIISDQKSADNQLEQKQAVDDNLDNQENAGDNLKQKPGETGTADDQQSMNGLGDDQKNTEDNPEQKFRDNNDINNQEKVGENPEQKTGESNVINSQECLEDSYEHDEESVKNKLGPTKEKVKSILEQKEEASSSKDDEESEEENQELITGSYGGIKSPGSARESSEIKTEICNAKNQKSENMKIATMKEACNGIKGLESKGVKPELRIKTCNLACNPETKDVQPEIISGAFNRTCVSETGKLKPEVKTGECSWNKMKFILSHPCVFHSFYTTQESVKINYEGPETFGKQKVDIYLIKERVPSLPEETVVDAVNENKMSFEDFFSRNTESYIEIPAILNEAGDLIPLTLGPLTAGSYWVVIAPEGNKTKASEQEKKFLLAKHFKVLEFEMGAQIPGTIEEGEDFKVNLTLKNAPAQENYIYWAVLIKEDSCRDNIDTKSESKVETESCMESFDITRSFGIGSINSGADSGKNELKNEIQVLIGEGNGTISIGEENQSTLFLKTLGLHSGNYLLFAGAYEKDNDLAGIVQKKLTISAAKTNNSYSKTSRYS